ncbi:bacteriohemerythrin [Methylocucumis oryzae]|uniref:Bacteriohemerythrin n=1 Tax=Methylocucumis oryzae TaxID=1632867 RepID=A0A0F3IHK5_9GAMM|nr:bacteriohemerythrin [Methylocucumis oryzae]KJV06275.1 bacteriohemerythrin [Methylocucumis oryzae]
MALMNWTADQYGTNVGFADEEHKVIFAKLNTLYDLATGGAERSAIGAQLDDLIGYVAEHFAHEEREMQAKGYSAFAPHKAEHDAMVQTCVGLQAKFHAGEADVTDAVGQMVKSWLDKHIPTFDKGYSQTLNS